MFGGEADENHKLLCEMLYVCMNFLFFGLLATSSGPVPSSAPQLLPVCSLFATMRHSTHFAVCFVFLVCMLLLLLCEQEFDGGCEVRK